ncbi:MAG: zinc ribbon domain-containing protein [Chloroflexi bacterium]|nr:zinc ribbon domain-containing protein [Chloroflexota bacterium]
MNRKVNWWVIATLVFLVALVLTSASSLLGLVRGSGWSDSGWERWQPGMDTNWGIWRISFLPFRCLMPALFITLVVMGIVWLIRAVGGPAGARAEGPATGATCSGCGRSIRTDWQACPYCGQKLN